MALLHWLSSARSFNSLVWVRAWVTKMTCFACQESCFFLTKFPLSSDLIYKWAQMHLIILRGRNPRRPIRINLFVCKKSSSAHSRRASRQLLAKAYALKTGYLPKEGFHVRRLQCSKTAWPIKAKFYVEPPWVGGTKVCSRHLGHMTKLAATPNYSKNPSKIFA